LTRLIRPDPPCFSLLKPVFSLFERGRRFIRTPKRYFFSNGYKNKAARGAARGPGK
jgi:hypothetical protein